MTMNLYKCIAIKDSTRCLYSLKIGCIYSNVDIFKMPIPFNIRCEEIDDNISPGYMFARKYWILYIMYDKYGTNYTISDVMRKHKR